MTVSDKIKGDLAANCRATWNAMVQAREARDLLAQLNSQWEDLVESAQQTDKLAWLDFVYDLWGKGGVTLRNEKAEWESWNPDWQIVGNGIRRRKKP